MNTLRLENINLQAPYKVLQDPEKHNNFYFVSDSGIRFIEEFFEANGSETMLYLAETGDHPENLV